MNMNHQEKTAADYDKEGKEVVKTADYKKACECFEKARHIYQKQKDPINEAFQCFNIAQCYQNLKMPDEAIKAYAASYELIKGNHTLSGQQAMVLNNMGHLHVGAKQFDQALNCFNKAVNLSETLGDTLGKALQLQNIGSVYRDSHQSEKALKAYYDSIALFEKIGEKMFTADQCTNIAYIYSVDKKPGDALTWYKKALGLYEELKNERKAALTRQNINHLKIQL
jgi:tetratricopeptide (TPR) repeat protein